MDAPWFAKGRSTRLAVLAAVNMALAFVMLLMGNWPAALLSAGIGLALLGARWALRPATPQGDDLDRAIAKSVERVGRTPP
jgi:hypothetical protein